MAILERIINSFVFWGAWIIIPVLAEIVPSIGSPLKPKIQDKEKRLEEAGVIPGDFPDCAGL